MMEAEAIEKAKAYFQSSIGGDSSSEDIPPVSVRRTNKGNGWFVELKLLTHGAKLDPNTTIILVRDDGKIESMPMM